MLRIRGYLPLAVSTALLVFACASGLACNKGGDAPGAPGTGASALTGGGSASPLDYMPPDSSLVVGLNWSKFKGTKFYNMMTANLPPDAKTKLDQVKQVCSLDPLNDFDSVLVGGTGTLDKTAKFVVVIKGNWNKDKITKCVTAMSEKDGKKVTLTEDGNLTTITPPNEKPMTIGWAGDLMIITSTSTETDKTYINEVMKHATSVKTNKVMMDLLGKTDQGATIYGSLVTPPGSDMASATNKVTGGTEKLAGAYGTIKLGSDLDTNFGLRFGADADAKTVSDKLNTELENAKKNPQSGAYLTNTTIKADGTDSVINLKLDEKQLDQITEMMKQMAPMFMGGVMNGLGGGGQ